MKKLLCISGTLLAPLKEGRCAVILHGGDCIRTSLVVEILEQSDDFVHFETMNSVYKVSCAPVPAEATLALCA